MGWLPLSHNIHSEGDKHMIKRHFVSNQRSFFKNAKTVLAGFLAFFILLILLPSSVSAAGTVPTLNGVVQGTGLPMVNLTVILLSILRIFFGFLGVIAVALLIYAGFIWMTAQGDPAKVTKAKQIIYNTIIGLIIIFSAFAITSFLMAWLTGIGGGGGGNGAGGIPGGMGDWSRSAIGAGPIQSVYPAPNAVNVPINTRIAVTFKVDIKPSSICDLSAGGTFCDGNIIKNVTICEISATSSDCLANSAFNASVYASSSVRQASPTDFKTFIFSTNNNLGNDDQQNRTFKVVLNSGIIASSTNKSVFDGLRVNYYSWAFKTNGVLDLTPPQVANLEIYPNPDNTPDAYSIGSQSTAGLVSVTLSNFTLLRKETPASLNGKQFNGTALTGISATKESGAADIPDDYFTLSTAGFSPSGVAAATLKFTVDSNTQGKYIQFSDAPDAAAVLGVKFSTTGVCSGQLRCLPVINDKQVDLSGSGIMITSAGKFSDAKGSRWSFTVTPAINGDTVSLLQSSSTIANFIFADDSYGDQITKSALGPDGRTILNTFYYTIKPADIGNISYSINAINKANLGLLTGLLNTLNAKAGNLLVASTTTEPTKITISAKSAGQNNLSLVTSNPTILGIIGNLSGSPRVVSRTALPPGSKPDPYNNSVFMVSFTEAINPINVGNYIKIKINGVDVVASTTLTNQYKTLELMGTNPCGVNSCGQQMYCWVDLNTNAAVSIPATTTIIAASLKYCQSGNENSAGNEWCKKFGGTCNSSSDNGRCKLAGGLYYPQAGNVIDGITDMANNSFNGNFDKASSAKDLLVGNAQGQSGSGAGKSGQPTYDANNYRHFDGLKFSFANDNDAYGDNFSWSFFISTQIDTAAPLLVKILPIGDYSLGLLNDETFHDPVRLVFNGLMRLATLQPGWGYGENKNDADWNIRYLILKTITAGANPVGYWVNSTNLDEGDPATGQGRNDGLADYTVADLDHNPFDQAISYGPLAGSGIQSITQNCFLPGNGPISAGANGEANNCVYNSDGSGTAGCVTDASIPLANRVTSTNPSSYGYMNCADIDGATECGPGKICKIQNATSSGSNVRNGSWIITKNHPDIKNLSTGETGCCFGACLNSK